MKVLAALFCLLFLCRTVLAAEPPTFSLAEEAEVEVPETSANERPEATAPAARRTQWLMFTASWCQPCAAAKADFADWLQRSGWIVDETEAAHVRLIDGDEQPALVRRYQITQYPTFVLVRDGEILVRQPGYPGRQELVARYQQAAAGPAVGAVPIGTIKGQCDTIRQIIAALRPILSGGGTLTLRLDRTQSQTAMLALGDSLSVRIDDPLEMNFTLKDDCLTCRFDEPLPRARVSFGIPLEQPVSAVTLSVSEVVLELPRAPDVKLRVEP